MSSPEQITHNILASEFTDRYAKKAHISLLAYGEKYDQDSFLSDYDTTWWPAEPNKHSLWIAATVLGGYFRMRPRTINRLFYQPVAERAEDIMAARREYPLMTIGGHDPDLTLALPELGASRALAAKLPGDYKENLSEMFRQSHVVATRGFVPFRIGRPWLPKSDRLTLVRAARLVFNPHFTFPRTETMSESGIGEDFIDGYNARARKDMIGAVKESGSHPSGLHQGWAMAPAGAPDLKGAKLDKKYPGLPPGSKVACKVGGATIHLVKEMGCGIVPAYTRISRRSGETEMQLGKIIPPDEITGQTLPGIMHDLVVFRRTHGERNVYYEDELQ